MAWKKHSKRIDALLVSLKGPEAYNPSRQYEVPLGLLSIATYSETQGFHVLVLNDPNVTLDLLRRITAVEKIEVLGFNCDAENVWSVMSVINILKASNTSLLCVAGGPQVSAIPWDERILNDSKCDVVVRGDGEEAFSEILKYKHNGTSSLESIHGITYNIGNKVIRNSENKTKFSEYPIPDRNLTYFPSSPTGSETIYTSRGCPYHCAFCFEAATEYRTRDISEILAEVEILLKERLLRRLAIVDDIFMVSIDRMQQICKGFKKLQKKYHRFNWYCEGRANLIAKNPEIIKTMIDAGLVRLQIGIESGDQSVLDQYNKELSLDDIRTTVNACYRQGLDSIVGNFIIGGSFETWDTVRKSISFANELLELAPGCIDTSSSMYSPYPGTSIFNNPQKYGIEILDADSITGTGCDYAFVKTRGLSKSDILDAYALFNDETEKKAVSLIPKVSSKRARQIFEAHDKLRIDTMWFTLLSQYYYNYYNYYGLQVTEDRIGYKKVPRNRVEEYKPLRTVKIDRIVNGELLLNENFKRLKLSVLSTRIFELCSGKITVKNIIEVLCGEYDTIDRAILKSYVLLALKKLDNEKLIIFSLV